MTYIIQSFSKTFRFVDFTHYTLYVFARTAQLAILLFRACVSRVDMKF